MSKERLTKDELQSKLNKAMDKLRQCEHLGEANLRPLRSVTERLKNHVLDLFEWMDANNLRDKLPSTISLTLDTEILDFLDIIEVSCDWTHQVLEHVTFDVDPTL